MGVRSEGEPSLVQNSSTDATLVQEQSVSEQSVAKPDALAELKRRQEELRAEWLRFHDREDADDGLPIPKKFRDGIY